MVGFANMKISQYTHQQAKIVMVLCCIIVLNLGAKGQYIGSVTCFNDRERAGGAMYPYNQSLFLSETGEAEWWDNLVEEIYHSGIDFSALLCRGYSPARPTTDDGDPRKIPNMIAAMDRRGLGNAFKLAIFDDCPAGWTAAANYDRYGNTGHDPKFDCGDTSNYKYIWDYNIKEAIENIPDERRFKIDGRMVIIFWSVKPTWMTNIGNGNLVKILAHIRSECQKEFGFNPFLVVQECWFDNDSQLSFEHVDAVHDWFSAARGVNWTLYEANERKFGVVAPGFAYEGDPDRPLIDPDHGQTLVSGLEGTVNAGAFITLCEGFTDAAEAAAFWRSGDETYYDYPNQRLNILRRYSQKAFANHRIVQAEACDYFYDVTAGNDGKAFREGDLDIQKTHDAFGGWTVMNAEAGEWLEWKEISIPKNAQFEMRYAAAESATIQIMIDESEGEILALPSTGSTQVWDVARDRSFSIVENKNGDVKIKILSGNISLNYFTIIGEGGTGVVAINSPGQNERYLHTDTITLDADAIGFASEIGNIELYVDNSLVSSFDSSSVNTSLAKLSPGSHSIKFKATDVDGNVALDSVSIYIGTVAYTISDSIIGDGEIVLDPPGGVYVEGTEVTMNAEPGTESFFNGWSGDTITTDNPLVFTISADMRLAATFLEVKDPAFKVNFQPNTTAVPEGYLKDTGKEYGLRDNGYTYGWKGGSNGAVRDRGSHEDVRYATLNHMQSGGAAKTWEMNLANGTYIVYLVMGDPDYTDQINNVDIEGLLLEDPDGIDNFDEYHAVVEVNDNHLSISPGEGSSNAKICFAEITVEELTHTETPGPETDHFALLQNYPNPFTGITNIEYTLPTNGLIRLNVYNFQGQLISSLVNEYRAAGTHQVSFDATGLPAGIYFYHLQCGPASKVKKMIVVK